MQAKNFVQKRIFFSHSGRGTANDVPATDNRPAGHNKRIQMQAIITKYLPPTNRRGSRVKATCERGSITVPWDSNLDAHENHEAACRAMCEQFDAEDRKEYGSTLGNWSRPKASGGLASGEWVHCFIPSSYVKGAGVVEAEVAS